MTTNPPLSTYLVGQAYNDMMENTSIIISFNVSQTQCAQRLTAK